ncbi:SRPBCC family protein [Methylocella silvestris]|uniref:MxaD protein n=1 Tax=Methylocella silvestris TaxID=199596 RepID=A0A2J7TF48_METSI|nr:SRPBCC family protein [Methylocella silvestris]PNG25401.1 MxaD protein [Methylocella silvestris]
MVKTLILAAALTAAGALPALAVDVSRSAEIKAPAATVWSAIGDFCGIANWHPAIEKCEISTKDGVQMRTLTLKGGGTIVEQQQDRNDDDLNYRYIIVESPLPVEDYVSTIEVEPIETGSKVTWSGTFKAKGVDDAKAAEVIAGIYEAGLKGITDKAK